MDKTIEYLKRFAKADHYRALVAAFYGAPAFAARASWRAVQGLQHAGVLEHGRIELTRHGRDVVEWALEHAWFAAGWADAVSAMKAEGVGGGH